MIEIKLAITGLRTVTLTGQDNFQRDCDLQALRAIQNLLEQIDRKLKLLHNKAMDGIEEPGPR